MPFLSSCDCLTDVQTFNLDSKIYDGAKEFSAVYKMLMSNPELYINGEADTKEEAQEEIKDFVKSHFYNLIMLTHLFGKNAIEQLFRRREDGVDEYIYKFDEFSFKYEELLEKLLNCKNKDGSDFSIKQKLTFVDILAGFEACGVEANKIEEKIKDNKIDLAELEKFLLKETFRFCGISDDEFAKIPDDKFSQWNLEYISLLAYQQKENREENNDDTLADLIQIANLDGNFKENISKTGYGQINEQTKKIFKKLGLDYDKWFNPSKSLELQFKYTDSNQAMLAQIIAQIEEDIESLRKTPAKGFIDKHFSDCIVDSKFKINEKYAKQLLLTFTKNMFELLDKNIFSRAQKSLDNPNKKKNAQLTLTIKNHLEQRLKDISQCEIKKKERPIDLTIKMWDRNPAYDLFQGNYSTCCISIGGANGSAMPHYLLNSAFNMIELKDNSTGETIGNALCYFATDEFNEPLFVIDNIEIANKHKMSNKASAELLNEMKDIVLIFVEKFQIAILKLLWVQIITTFILKNY